MVQASFAHFCRIRDRTIDMVQALSQEQMDSAPVAGEWSIGEILDHLLLSERMYRRDIAELIQLALAGREPRIYRSFRDMNAGPLCMPSSLLPLFEIPFNFFTTLTPWSVREFIARNDLVPMRHADVTTPRQRRSVTELLLDLAESIRETETLFVEHRNLNYDKMVHHHPLLGIQTVPQLLDLMSIHEELHQGQIFRLRANPRFPNAA